MHCRDNLIVVCEGVKSMNRPVASNVVHCRDNLIVVCEGVKSMNRPVASLLITVVFLRF